MCNYIIMAIIGVGGTLLGTILGWILNSLSSHGKLRIFVTSWKETFQYNNSGYMENSRSKRQTEYYWYELKIDLYNSSDEIKIMRDIKIEFLNGKEISFVQVPYDDAITKYSSHSYIHYDIGAINIPPKSIIQHKLCNGCNKKDGKLDDIWKSDRVLLSYIDKKNKKKTVYISSLDYENYFNQIDSL